eukprot:EG_transcript_5915
MSQASFASVASYSELYAPGRQRTAYSAFVASGAEHVERALDLLGPELPPGAAVLEIGTRNGAVLAALRGLVGPQGCVTGIAMGDGERKHALKQLITDGLEAGITVHDRIPAWQVAPPASLDGVVLTYLLELLEPDAAASILAECRSVLRPTGHLAVVAVTAVGASGPFRLPLLRPSAARLRPVDLRTALRATGFSADVVKSTTSWGWNVEVVLASVVDELADPLDRLGSLRTLSSFSLRHSCDTPGPTVPIDLPATAPADAEAEAGDARLPAPPPAPHFQGGPQGLEALAAAEGVAPERRAQLWGPPLPPAADASAVAPEDVVRRLLRLLQEQWAAADQLAQTGAERAEALSHAEQRHAEQLQAVQEGLEARLAGAVAAAVEGLQEKVADVEAALRVKEADLTALQASSAAMLLEKEAEVAGLQAQLAESHGRVATLEDMCRQKEQSLQEDDEPRLVDLFALESEDVPPQASEPESPCPISCGKAVWEGEPATEGDVPEVIACGGKEAPRATGGGLGHLGSLACVTGGAVVAPLDLRRCLILQGLRSDGAPPALAPKSPTVRRGPAKGPAPASAAADLRAQKKPPPLPLPLPIASSSPRPTTPSSLGRGTSPSPNSAPPLSRPTLLQRSTSAPKPKSSATPQPHTPRRTPPLPGRSPAPSPRNPP